VADPVSLRRTPVVEAAIYILPPWPRAAASSILLR
jgi:hypothetical protein